MNENEDLLITKALQKLDVIFTPPEKMFILQVLPLLFVILQLDYLAKISFKKDICDLV